MADQEEVERRHRAVLEAFVVRSRRVDAHSLMTDPEKVLAMSKGEMKLQLISQSSERFLVQDLPSEEVLESAAARLRPLILKEDPVYWGKALKALGYFLRDNNDPEIQGPLSELKDRWRKRVDTQPGKARAYFLQLKRGDDAPTSTIVDSDLGMAWFYGDVVHADAGRREVGAVYGIKERYRAAALLISNVLVCNRMTLNFIRELHERGLLELDGEAFSEEVVVADTHFRSAAQFYVGAPGTEMPKDITGSIPEGFEQFDPGKHLLGGRRPAADAAGSSTEVPY